MLGENSARRKIIIPITTHKYLELQAFFALSANRCSLYGIYSTASKE